MKLKISIIAILTLFISSFIFMGTTYAQDDFNLRGGVSYTTISDNDFEDVGLDSGVGFYVGGEYDINNSMKWIGQYEKYFFSETITETDPYTGETESANVDIDLNAIVGLISLDLMDDQETSFVLMGGPGYYFGELSGEEAGVSMSFDLESSLGVKFGAGISSQIQENISFNANGFYRMLETGLELEDGFTAEDADFSGFEISGGLAYNF